MHSSKQQYIYKTYRYEGGMVQVGNHLREEWYKWVTTFDGHWNSISRVG